MNTESKYQPEQVREMLRLNNQAIGKHFEAVDKLMADNNRIKSRCPHQNVELNICCYDRWTECLDCGAEI